MIETIGYLAIFVSVGFVLSGISSWLGSQFLSGFLDANLITLLIALLAINITTISVIMTKLKEISEKENSDFSATVRQMKKSVREQVGLVVVAIGLQIAKSVPALQPHRHVQIVISAILAGIMFWDIYILYDTANGVFVILEHENNPKK